METAGSVDQIREKIRRDSEAEADDVLRKARASAEEEIRKAEKQAEAIRKEASERACVDVERRQRSQLSGLALEVRRKELRERENLFDEVLEEARKAFVGHRKKAEYKQVLERLVTEAVLGIGGGEVALTVADREKEILSGPFLKNLARKILREQGIEAAFGKVHRSSHDVPGVLVSGKGGRVQFDNTLPAILYRGRERIRLEVKNLIFGEADQA